MKIPCDIKNDYLEIILGDVLMSNMQKILANTCNGDLKYIKSIIECGAANIYHKGIALESLTILAISNIVPRTAIIDYLKLLLENNKSYFDKKPRSARRFYDSRYGLLSDDNLLLNGYIIGECYDLCATELLPLIKQIFKENMVDKGYVFFEEKMIQPDQLWIDKNINYTNNIIEILESWGAFF